MSAVRRRRAQPRVVATGLACAGIACAGLACESSDAQRLQDARNFGAAGAHDHAVRLLRDLREKRPDSAQINLELGLELARMGETNRAIVYLIEAASSPTTGAQA